MVDIQDKVKVSKNYFAFTGLLHVKDYQKFWKGIEKLGLIKHERQISNGLIELMKESKLIAKKIRWFDVGDYKKYQDTEKKFNSSSISKTNEFIYFTNNNVIKFFSDEDIINKRIQKTKSNQSVFPKVKKLNKNFYQYPYWEGETFYSIGSPESFKKLLEWLENRVWKKSKTTNTELEKLCKSFYYDKTVSRISLFLKNNPNYIFPRSVNAKVIPSLEKLLESIPWEKLFDGIPRFIHGDLQIQNILYNRKLKQFLLVDWRQDFAGNIKVGDLYYDLAKLYGGILMNYDHIISDNFQYNQNGKKVTVSFKKWKNDSKYKKILEDYIKKNNIELYKVRLLTGLIYLNMA